MNLELKKRITKCLVWSVALYAAETWTLTKKTISCWRVDKRFAGLVKLLKFSGKYNEDRQIQISIWQIKHRWIGLVLRHDTDYCMKLKVDREVNQQQGEEFKCYGTWFGKRWWLRCTQTGSWGQTGMETQRKDVKNLLYCRRLPMMNTCGVFLGGQPRFLPKGAGSLRPPIFWDPLPTPKRFDVQQRNLITRGEYSVFLVRQLRPRRNGRGPSVPQIFGTPHMRTHSVRTEKQQPNFAWWSH